MAYVDFKKSLALRASARQRLVNKIGFTIARWFARGVTLIGILLAALSMMSDSISNPQILGFIYCMIAVSLAYLVADMYMRTGWAALPDLPPLSMAMAQSTAPNLADFLDIPAVQLIENSLQYAKNTQLALSADVMFASLLEPNVHPVLSRAGCLDSEDVKDFLRQAAVSPETGYQEVTQIFEWAAEGVLQVEHPILDDGALISSIVKRSQLAQTMLFNLKVAGEDVDETVAWFRRVMNRIQPLPIFETPVGAGVAADWTSGYVHLLNQAAHNLTQAVASQGNKIPIYGRDKEINSVEQQLAREQGNNVLLVGDTGVGKMTIVLGVAQRMNLGLSPKNLQYSHLYAADISSLLAGVSDRGEIEARLLQMFNESISAGNVILCLPDIHLLLGGGDDVGSVNASQVLMQVLQSPQLRVIATITPAEYQRVLSSNAALVNLFDRQDISELTPESSLEVLEDSIFTVERDTKAYFTVPSMRRIVEIAERYVHDVPFPQKALKLLDDLGAELRNTPSQYVTADVVNQLLSEKLQLPLQAATGDEKDQLLHLEEELHKTVVGQEEAISAIAAALRRARAGLDTGKRPIASFLFLGPTGVGKTESAKALARVYFGDEKRMIRLDMSEYQQSDGLVRMIGAPNSDGSKTGGYLADAVHDQPFSLVLLDELEKAHPQILNLFLQILDDGRLTDGTGRLIDFTNAIIIATSNAGAELIRESVLANETNEIRREKLLSYLQQQGIFRPEFLNRFDGIVAFRPLDPEQVQAVVRLMLGDLAKRMQEQQQISLSFGEDLVAALAQQGFDPQFGARPIRRLIQDKVETWLSNQILAGSLQRGMSAEVTASMIGLNLLNSSGTMENVLPQQPNQ